MDRIFILGNGTSRKGLDLSSLKSAGPVYGCNALYRDFSPDILFSVDPPMIEEIIKSGYHLTNTVFVRKVIDKNVRYGGNYFYKLRTLCKVEMIAQDDSDQNVLAKFLMASEGKITNILCVEEVPPPPPQSLKVTFDFETLLPYIRWELPHNKQRDIKRFQVFKRFNTSESFTLIAEIDFDNSYDPVKLTTEVAQKDAYYKVERIQKSFLDKTHKEGEKPIYSVCCVDAHGLSSNYGAQVQVERDRYTNKVNRKIISGPNAPKP